MGNIINNILTRFGVVGADGTRRAVDNITRSQTRLGQASASSGRQFSAQAKGLGGLVTVYAGAAANIFAVQQAFSALSRAAQAEQIIQGTRALAGAIGESGDEILAKIKEITRSQLTMTEVAQNVNIALSASFSSKQIERLSAISLKASVSLGRNLTDALQRVVRGAAKLEPELLDELGIFTRIEPAVQKYAIQLGRSATSLTNFERRQAFVNAVMEEGERKFASIGTTAPTAAQSLEKLAATMVELATIFGQFMADTLVPLADFFSDNMGASLALFSGMASTILGTLFRTLGKAASNLGSTLRVNLNETLNATAQSSQVVANRMAGVHFQMARLNEQDNPAMNRFKGEGKAQFAALTRLSETNDVRPEHLREINRVSGEQIRLTEQNIAARQRDIATIDRRIASLNNESNAQGASQEVQARNARMLLAENRLRERAVGRLDNQTAALGQWRDVNQDSTTAQREAERAAGGARLGFQRLKVGIAGAFTGLAGFLGQLGIIISMGSFLLGILAALAEKLGIAEDIGRLFSDIGTFFSRQFNFTEAVEEMENGIRGFTDSLIELNFEGEKVPKQLELMRESFFSIFGDDPIPLTLDREKINKEVSQLGEDIGAILRAKTEDAGRALAIAVELGIPLIDVEQNKTEGGLAGAISPKTITEEAAKMLIAERINAAFLGAQPTTAQDHEFLESLIISAVELGERLAEMPDTVQVIGQVAHSTGIEAKVLVDHFTTLKQAGKDSVDFIIDFKYQLGNAIGSAHAIVINQQLIRDLAKDTTVHGLRNNRVLNTTNGAIKAYVGGLALSVELQEELNHGLITGEGISSRIIAIKSIIQRIDSDRNALEQERVNFAEDDRDLLEQRINQLDMQAKKLREIVSILAEMGDQQINIELITKALTQTFGSQIAMADKLTGLMNDQGQIATTPLEARRNQVQFLGVQLTTAKNFKILGSGGGAVGDFLPDMSHLATASKRSEQLVVLIKILKGQLIKTTQEAFKLGQQLGKNNIALNNKNIQQGFKNQLANLRNQQSAIQQIISNKRTMLSLEQNLLKIQQKATLEVINANKIQEKQLFAIQQESMSGPLSEFFTDEQRSNLEISIAKQDLEDLRNITKIQMADRLALLDVEKQLLFLELDSASSASLAAIDAAIYTKEAALAKIEGDKVLATFENESLRIKADLIREEATILRDHVNALSKIFRDATENQLKAAGVSDAEIREQLLDFGNINAPTLEAQLIGLETTVAKGIADRTAQQESASRHATTQAEQAYNAAVTQADRDLSLAMEVFNTKTTLAEQTAELDRKMLQVALDTKLSEFERMKAIAELTKDTFLQLMTDITKILKDKVADGLRALNTAIRDQTLTLENFKEGFKEHVRGIISGVQDAIFEKTVIEPIQDFIGNTIGGFFNLEDPNTLKHYKEGDAIRVFVKNIAGLVPNTDTRTIPSSVGNVVTENNAFGPRMVEAKSGLELFSEKFQQFGLALAGSFTSILAAGGDFKQGMIGVFLSMFAQIMFSSIAKTGGMFDISKMLGSLSFASGGGVPGFASGGLRDSVRANLEPGEFVVRKSAVRSMGLPAMKQINATGRAPGSGAPVVNIHNEGTPQEPSKQPNISFNPEKMVVDIFLRDIQSNGPIRQTLRGGKI